jgi:hypothetical protein
VALVEVLAAMATAGMAVTVISAAAVVVAEGELPAARADVAETA